MPEDGSAGVQFITKRIVDEFRREGMLTPESVESAGFEQWDRVVPSWIVLVALQSVIRVRWEKGISAVGQVPRDLTKIGLSHDEAALVIGSLLGDVAGGQEAQARGLLTLQSMLGLFCAMAEEDSLSPRQLDDLFELGEEICRETLRSGTPIRLPVRGVEVGPWDASEEEAAPRLDRVDLGGLRVPTSDGFEIQPMHGGDTILAVTVIQGPTAIQLQAFRSEQAGSWEGIRQKLLSRIRVSGGSASEWFGVAGVEIRAEVPVTDQAGRPARRRIKILGCDGSRWTLRGLVSGLGGEPDSTDDWAYETFLGTVVVPDFWDGRDTTIALQWPQTERQ
ncbi:MULTISPECIES: DUF3710 domain-containing protein [unclassified Streptomyces]|uniref:DUF3710 domain-containing protein n=1 Tax=unclassified Streptomyces TaxID=2593676 RepID=UPI0036493C0A